MALPPSYIGGAFARSMPLPQADNSGARAIAGAVEQLGAVGAQARQQDLQVDARIEQIQRDRIRQDQVADFGLRFAQKRAELSQQVTELRAAPAPGAKGHADQVNALWDQASKDLIDPLTDPEARRSALTMLADYGGRLKTDEYQFETAKRIEKLGTDAEGTFDQQAINARGMNDEKSFMEEINRVEQYVATLGLGGDTSEKLIRLGKARIARGFMQGMMERNPAAARQLLAQRQISSMLGDPDTIDRLSRGIDVEEQRVANEIERANRMRMQAEKEEETTALGEIGRGVVLPSDQLVALAGRAEARGDTSKAAELRAAAVGAQVNRIYGNGAADAGQMTNRIAAIEGNRRWRENPVLVAEHAQLERLRAEQRNAMPEMGELNLNDPAAIARRSTESRAWAARNEGRRYIFNRDQATELTNLAQSGPQGRVQVAEALSRLRGDDALVGLWQVARGDVTLRAAIDLPPALRAEVFRGEALAKQNPQLVSTRDVNELWGERIQPALDGLPVERQADVKAAATALFAADARAGEWNADAFVTKVNRVLSPNGGGGIGSHKGKPIVLPNGMTQRELDRRWAGMADNISATDGSGRRLGRSLVQSQYRMVPSPRDGYYYLADPRGNFAMSPRGGRYTLNVRQMGSGSPPSQAAPGRAVPSRGGGSAVFIAPPQRDLGVAVPVYRAPPVK